MPRRLSRSFDSRWIGLGPFFWAFLKSVQAMSVETPLPYKSSFEYSMMTIWDQFCQWMEVDGQGLPNFDNFEDCVYLKNRDRVVVYVNSKYMEFYGPKKLPIGNRGEVYLEKAIAAVGIQTDLMIAEGYRSVEIDHIGPSADGTLHLLRTFKRSTAEFGRPEIWILGITRPVARFNTPGATVNLTLAEYAKLYLQLTEEEAEMCRLFAMGEATRVIADVQGVSSRTIELRRQKVLEQFGFHRPIEIVKLLVRLQASGFIDIDV